MQGELALESSGRRKRQIGFAETELEHSGIRLQLGAPVTGSVATDNQVAVGFGDGTVRFFSANQEPITVQAHGGAVLCIASDQNDVVTGGDDGRLLRISPGGAITEVANFGTKWVDCVASSGGIVACSSGRHVHVWMNGRPDGGAFEHISTVGGLAISKDGNLLAATHFGGVTVRQRVGREWKETKFEWKGSHGPVTFSPDGVYVVTAMQERALHGWRLRDKGHFEMAGYPAKIKSFAWVGDTPYLATSGADEAICWPFDGEDGPMGRGPVSVARNRGTFATVVNAIRGKPKVLTGFRDGAVLVAELDETREPIPIRGSTGIEVTAITISSDGTHVFVGDAEGNVLWGPLSAEGRS